MSKIVHRRARLDDLSAIADLAVESVSNDPLPVNVDREAMMETGRSLINPAHFMWVSEDENKKVVAAVAACAQRSFWYRGLQCSILLYYSRTPGAGVGLLRELARWAKSRTGIKVAVLELEPGVDPRLIQFFKRLGFTRESLNLTYVRGT